MLDKATLRKEIRVQRESLSHAQQQHAAKQVLAQITRQTWYNAPVQVGYWACFGEINPQPLFNALMQRHVCVGLPILHPICTKHLLFLRTTRESIYQSNHLGIPEPKLQKNAILTLEQIQVLYLPLVAFDKNGHRLGMGGGYYDRTLGHYAGKRPLLVGLAHDFQCVERLPVISTDITLDIVVTPTTLWHFSSQI